MTEQNKPNLMSGIACGAFAAAVLAAGCGAAVAGKMLINSGENFCSKMLTEISQKTSPANTPR